MGRAAKDRVRGLNRQRQPSGKRSSMAIKFDVFGRLMLAERTTTGWQLFYLGDEGKRRPATDLVVPEFISEAELDQYLADIFHESASSKHSTVQRLPS
jgi:hypothetical protein